MGWHYPSVEAICDRCGRTDYIDGDSIGSGHYLFPTADEVGWGWGEEGDLCPDCLEGKEESDASV